MNKLSRSKWRMMTALHGLLLGACMSLPLQAGDLESTARSLQEKFGAAVVPMIAVLDVTAEFRGQSQSAENPVDLFGCVFNDKEGAHRDCPLESLTDHPGSRRPSGGAQDDQRTQGNSGDPAPTAPNPKARSSLKDHDLDLAFIKLEGEGELPTAIPLPTKWLTTQKSWTESSC